MNKRQLKQMKEKVEDVRNILDGVIEVTNLSSHPGFMLGVPHCVITEWEEGRHKWVAAIVVVQPIHGISFPMFLKDGIPTTREEIERSVGHMEKMIAEEKALKTAVKSRSTEQKMKTDEIDAVSMKVQQVYKHSETEYFWDKSEICHPRYLIW